MNNKNMEMINMLSGDVISFDECMDNLCHTRDIDIYLNSVLALRDRYLIILSVKVTLGKKNDQITEIIHKIGFKNFINVSLQTYAGAVYKGEVICDKCGGEQNAAINFEGEAAGKSIGIVSMSRKRGAVSQIKIGGTDYSLNLNGLNFVVYDCDNNLIVDSAVYDSNTANPEFYHKKFAAKNKMTEKTFYFPDKYAEMISEPFKKSFFSNRIPQITEVENGIIEPIKNIDGIDYGGVCDENFRFISGHVKHLSGISRMCECCECYKVSDEELEYSDEEVVFGGLIINHPGHLIIESLAERFWWLFENQDTNLRVAIIVLWDNGFARFFREFMEIPDFSPRKWFVVSKPTKFKKIIVPDPSIKLRQGDEPYEFTQKYADFFEKLKGYIKPGKHKKIYLTKSKTKYSNIMGEEFFIDFYKERGFHVIDPEDYSIKEKAELMLGADEVVTLSGTNSLYPVFCRPTTKVTYSRKSKRSQMKI